VRIVNLPTKQKLKWTEGQMDRRTSLESVTIGPKATNEGTTMTITQITNKSR